MCLRRCFFIARYFIGIHLTYCYFFFLLHIPPSSSRQAVWNVARSSVPLCRAETQWLNLCSAVPNAPVGKTLLTNTLFHWALVSWCDPQTPCHPSSYRLPHNPTPSRWSAQDPCRPEGFGQNLQVQRDSLPARGDLQQARPLPLQAKQPVCDVHVLRELHIIWHF